VGQVLHLDTNFIVKDGQHLNYGEIIGIQSGAPRKVGGKPYPIHAHIELEKEQFKKYISDLVSGKFNSTGAASACNQSTSSFYFPVVTEKGEQYKDADAIYKLLEKETSGFYLLSAHNFWHGGIHFTDVSVPHHIKDQPLRCMMDGKVIAYRLNKNYLTSNWLGNEMQYSSSFCLIQHEYESPANAEEGNNKGKKNRLTFYSLYMHLAPYSVYAFAADDVKKTKAKKQLKLIQTIRVRRGDDAVKGTPPSLGRLGAGSIVDLNGETSKFTVQEQGGSHSYTFAKGTISKACGKTDSHITEGTCIWVVDSAKYTEHVDQSTANKPCSSPAYWQCKMKGIVKNRVNARQIKDNNQPFSDANSESLGLLNITAEFEFNNKDVVTCSIGGKARKMAKATLLSGGYAEKAGQPPSPFWVCIDEPFVDLRAQAPTQFDSIVKCNQPIRAGDAIGFMGLYEVPKMPAACRQKVSKHQVHIEIFSTDSDSKIQAFLNNEAGLKTGKQYIKISAGASIYIKDKDTISFSTGGLKTQAECIVELSTCKKMSDSSSAIFYKVDKLPILNGAFDGYISEKELEILSQYELTKLGFKLLEEKNTNADGYLDPEKMPAFFQQLYKSIDKDGKNGVDSTEIAAAFKDQSKRNQLVKLVAKHPSEWHKSTINTIKTTFSNWASEATEDETKALMSHEKERMEKLEWMSQIAASPLVFGPAVWHFNPIIMSNLFGSSPISLAEARVRAFLRLIRFCEGTTDDAGYERLFGGQSFLKDYKKDFSDHPQIIITSENKKTHEVYKSSAAGAYQILGWIWSDKGQITPLRKKYGILNFEPENQDKCCIVFLKHKVTKLDDKDVLSLIIDGKYEQAIVGSCSYEWASMPPGRHGQPKKSLDVCVEKYNLFLDEEIHGKTTLRIKLGFLKEFGCA
jgi:muramidase (phage lysozyme)